jgi:hypothetical protein
LEAHPEIRRDRERRNGRRDLNMGKLRKRDAL